MSDLGERLLKTISDNFRHGIETDKKLRQIANRVRDGTSYTDASDYAVRLGELLSDALNDGTDRLAFMTEDVAREILEPLLNYDHSLVCEAVNSVQSNMYKSIGVGLKPSIPELDSNRIQGLAKKISGYSEFSDARWLINEPIINYSEAIVDQAIRDNAKKASKAGLEAKIVRKAEPSGIKTRKIGKRSYNYVVPCKWCSSLAGTYEYKSAPDDVYKRHAFCRCSVTFVSGKKKQDVWSKATWTGDDANAQREAIQKKQEELTAKRELEMKKREYFRWEIEKIKSELGVSDRRASYLRTVFYNDIQKYGLENVLMLMKTADRARA